MKTAKTTLRITLGALAIAFGLAIIIAVLALRGYFMRVGVVGGFDLISLLALGGLVLPPIMVGLHTLILRPRRDPFWNDKTYRAIGGVQFVAVMAYFYATYVVGSGTGFGYILALFIIGSVCISVIQRAPGGLDPVPQINP